MLTATQQAERLTGVGGSDAAVVLGVSKRKTTLQLYHEKRGELSPDEPDDPEAIWWGNALEPLVRQKYAEMTGRVVILPDTIRSVAHPFMLAHVDGLIQGERRGYEGKAFFNSAGWGLEGTDQIPPDALLQCHHYLTVLDYETWDCCLCVHRKIGIYTVTRDQEMSAMLVDAEADFMRRVREGAPPELDYRHRTAVDIVKKLHPGTNGQRLIATSNAVLWREKFHAASTAAKDAEIAQLEAKAHLLEEMGDAHLLAFPDGKAYRRQVGKRAGYTVDPIDEYLDCRFVNDPMAAKKRK